LSQLPYKYLHPPTAATESATTSNQPNLPSTFSTAFTMAKGDVVQQDKSFMGMPVSCSDYVPQAVQFQRMSSQQSASCHLNLINGTFRAG
jgi:hypothetical protein